MEKVLWEGKPFNYGLPSFTAYKITDSRIIVEKGIFTKKRDEIRLYRIRDVSTKRSLWERLFKMGDITVISSDASHASFVLRNIKQAIHVSDILGAAVEESRIRHRAFEVASVEV